MSSEIILSNNNEVEEGLVFIKNDDVYTDSKIVAEELGLKHHAVQQLIAMHKEDFEEFGKLKVAFRLRPSKTNQKQKIYLLNEHQTSLLLLYSRNTEKVREIKKKFIRQFFVMKECLEHQLSAKNDFPTLTRYIAAIYENPQPYHYSNECNMINKIVTGLSTKQFRIEHNIPKGESIRPHLTKEQIELLDYLQKVDIGLMISTPDYHQRKRHLEWAATNMFKALK